LSAEKLPPPVTLEKGVLQWGTDMQGAVPFAFTPQGGGELVGFEVELVAGLAHHLGLKQRPRHNEWDSLIPGVNRQLYDMALCGLEITPEHREAVDFSEPYYVTGLQFVVRKGTTALTTLASARGKAIGTLRESEAARLMRQQGNIDVRGYDTEINALTDLQLGRIDGVLIDAPVAIFCLPHFGKLEKSGPLIGRIEYGIVFRRGNEALRQSVNGALREMKRSGELRRILDRWNLWTPVMSAETGDMSPSITPPSAYEVHTQNKGRLTWKEQWLRYVGFLPLLAQASLMTLFISLLAMVLAIAAGFALALVRVYGPPPLAWGATLYIELVRGTPLLIQLLLIFYGLPHVGIELSPLIAGILGLGLNYAAYEAENYRAGINAIPRGQTEAALALGMTQLQTIRHVIVPQAFRIVLPPVTNDFISLLKDSSLVSVITVIELTKVYQQLATTYYDYLGIGLLTAAFYLILGLPFVWLARWTERKLRTDTRTVG
ncbi:MAG: ABC transporter substrate-binding protein/permease, partial [Verrucomicrobiae bacterium]|nr:ABC transporter substrate-binding protein/permease [Verrucomicrobiae bacterium]